VLSSLSRGADAICRSFGLVLLSKRNKISMTRPVAVRILCLGGKYPFCVSGGCRRIIYFFLEKGPLERFSVDVKTNK
jgi:hypothetical protein